MGPANPTNDQGDRESRRFREEVEKGLARNDLDLTLKALLKLTPNQRADFIPAAGRLLSREIAATHREKRWGPLSMWAARVDSEPRLAGTDSESAPVLWPLVWACARAKDWARARRLWALLVPAATEAPKLVEAMTAWLASDGKLSPDQESLFSFPAPPAPDLRLGYDPVRSAPRPSRAAPVSAAAAAAAVVGLADELPWERFADQVRSWAGIAPVPVALEIWVAAGRFALASVLRDCSSGRRPALSAVKLLQRAAQSAGAGALEREAVAGFRAVASCFPDGRLKSADEGELWSAAALGAVESLSGRDAVVAALSRFKAEPPAQRSQWHLVEKLLTSLDPPSMQLWARAVILWSVLFPDRDAPEPLIGATNKLAQAPGMIANWFKTAEKRDQVPLRIAAGILPVPVVERLVGAVAGAGETGCREAAAILVKSVERQSDKEQARVVTRMARSLGFDEIDGKPINPFELVGALGDELPRVLGRAEAALIRRWAPRLLSHAPDLLEIALASSETEREAEEFVELFLAGKSDAEALVQVFSLIEPGPFSSLTRKFEKRMTAAARGNAEALATLLDACIVGDFPRRLRTAVARELRALEGGPREGLSQRAILAMNRAATMTAKPAPKAPRKPRSPRRTAPPAGSERP